MEAYLLQSGVYLACFYTIYLILIRFRDNFNMNRKFILAGLIISSLLPFLDFQLFGSSQEQLGLALDPILFYSSENQGLSAVSKSSFSIFSIVYIIGLLVLSIRSITGLATLAFIYRRSQKIKYHGFTAVILSGNQSPFTFFNLLFINRSDYEQRKIDELIAHENVHRDQFHSIDLIITELFTIVHWFNPFAWLIKKDLKSEHEFYADEQVINQGFDKTGYQALLLKSHEGMAMYLTNNFNYSILKKRLVMMKKQKSNRLNFNYILAVPALLLVTSILFVNFKLNEQSYAVPDVMPSYKAGEKALYGTFQKAIKYPLEARAKNEQGTVFVSFTVTKDGKVKNIKAEDKKYNMLQEVFVVGYAADNATEEISGNLDILKKESERVAALLGEFKPGTKNDKAVDTRMTLPITFNIQ